MIRAHHERYSQTEIIARAFTSWTVASTFVQQSLEQFFNSHWPDCSPVTGTIVQQWLGRFFNSRWHDYSTVTGRIVQQLLARLFNSHWHGCLTVIGTFVQQSLARFFNSHWHDSSTAAGTILQQSWSIFFIFSMFAEFFNSDVHCWRIVPCTRNTKVGFLSEVCISFQNS